MSDSLHNRETMEIADKIHVNSFLIGILVALSLINAYLSYQANINSDKMVEFLVSNDFVK